MSLILFGAVLMWFLSKVSKVLMLLAMVALFVVFPWKAVLVLVIATALITSL